MYLERAEMCVVLILDSATDTEREAESRKWRHLWISRYPGALGRLTSYLKPRAASVFLGHEHGYLDYRRRHKISYRKFYCVCVFPPIRYLFTYFVFFFLFFVLEIELRTMHLQVRHLCR